MDLNELLARTASFRGAVRRLFLLEGTGRILLVLAGLTAFLFLADYFLILPGTVRSVLFVLAILAAGLSFVRWIARPLTVPITDDDAVLSVERAHPELKESLISALQFSRYDEAESRRIMSPAMVRATVKSALAAAAPLSFRAHLAPRGPLKTFLLGAAATAVLVVLSARFPDTSAIFFNRVYGGSVPWPARTHLTLISPDAERIRVAAGEELRVKVKVRGLVPSRVWVLYDFPETGESGEARMTETKEEGVFQFFFPPLVTPLACEIEAGDATPVSFSVDVLQPPRVSGIDLWITPPEYTKAPPTPKDTPQRDGNIKAPVGSEASLVVHASKAVERAWIVFHPGERVLEMQTVGPRMVRADFQVLLNERYDVNIEGKEGLKNRTPSRFSIRALKDRRPRIAVEKPETGSLWITPQASLPFRFTVQDDHGVKAVNLSTVRGHREYGPKKRSLEPVSPLSEAEKRWGPLKGSYETVLDFASLEVPGEGGARKVRQGDLVLALVEAFDFRRPRPNRTPSTEYRLTVVSQLRLEQLVEERMIQIKETLRRARDGQEKVKSQVETLEVVLDTEEVWDDADREKLLACQTGQRSVSRRLGSAAREFARILSTVVVNKLGDPEYQRKIQDMGALAGLLAGERCADTLEALESARASVTKPGQKKAVEEALRIQEDILRAVEDLLARMEKWEDYNEVIKIVREIIDFQKSILDESQNVAKEKEKDD